MSDYIKSIKAVQQVLLVASATVFAFALVPNRESIFEQADISLATLQSLPEHSWEEYLVDLQRSEQQRADSYIDHLIKSRDPSFEPQGEAMFVATDLTLSPLAGTLTEIRKK